MRDTRSRDSHSREVCVEYVEYLSPQGEELRFACDTNAEAFGSKQVNCSIVTLQHPRKYETSSNLKLSRET